MSIRPYLGAFAQPTRWLAACHLTFAAFVAASHWLGARSQRGLSPLSNDWLVDMERKSVRGQY